MIYVALQMKHNGALDQQVENVMYGLETWKASQLLPEMHLMIDLETGVVFLSRTLQINSHTKGYLVLHQKTLRDAVDKLFPQPEDGWHPRHLRAL